MAVVGQPLVLERELAVRMNQDRIDPQRQSAEWRVRRQERGLGRALSMLAEHSQRHHGACSVESKRGELLGGAVVCQSAPDVRDALQPRIHHLSTGHQHQYPLGPISGPMSPLGVEPA